MVGVNGDIFLQLGIIVIIATLAAFLLRALKQPQLIAYVLVGILIAPVFGIVTDISMIESMSIIGIAFLLFIVGIEIDLKKLQDVAWVSMLGGSIGIILIFTLGYLAALLLGFIGLEAGYIGLMLIFSSTMVVLKLLSDKRELNTLHGRIIVGILLLEDFIAIFVISILSSLNGITASLIGLAVVKFIILFTLAYFCSKFLFPYIFKFAAKNQELLLITSLAICFIFSLAFQHLGFSIAIGAFIAGITLGNLEYNLEIIGKVKSLRDFFALIFFVSLGMRISISALKDLLIPFIVFVALIILVKPFIIMVVCSLFKYTKKPAFQTATSLAQISEFSLIISMQGLALGHISQEVFSLVVLVMLATITISSYYINYSQGLYNFLEPLLRVFDQFTTEGLEYLPTKAKPKIILCGYNRIGFSILRDLHEVKKNVLILDYNPEIINQLVRKGYHCIYGEAADEEIIHRMNLSRIHILISTVPEFHDNLLLLKKVRAVNKKAKVFVTASTIDDALKLYEHGASYVIMPHFLGGEHVSGLITKLRKQKTNLKNEKEKQIHSLKERKEIGHEHPKGN